jgi:hypothetical protein
MKDFEHAYAADMDDLEALSYIGSGVVVGLEDEFVEANALGALRAAAALLAAVMFKQNPNAHEPSPSGDSEGEQLEICEDVSWEAEQAAGAALSVLVEQTDK